MTIDDILKIHADIESRPTDQYNEFVTYVQTFRALPASKIGQYTEADLWKKAYQHIIEKYDRGASKRQT